jgi:DNA-binding MarR family transcriptional regulator
MAHAFALEGFLPFRLPLVASRLTRIMERTCRPFGLSAPGWRIMALLGQTGAVPLREILNRSEMDKVRVSRAARQLRAQGYIEHQTVADDRRRVILQLTPRGKEVCRDLMRAVLDLQTMFVRIVGSEEYKLLEQMLDRFESQVKAAESPARKPIASVATLAVGAYPAWSREVRGPRVSDG